MKNAFLYITRVINRKYATLVISNVTCVVLSGLQLDGRDIVLLGEGIHRLVHLQAGSLAGI